MRRRVNTNKVKTSALFLVCVCILFLFFIMRLCYLCLANFSMGDVTIKEFIKNRNTSREIIMPSRGGIYDNKGEILAQDVASYTVIAYLSEKRSEGSSKPMHVVDKEKTAESLAPLINMEKDTILALLNKEGVYQVELGPGGRNLSELDKDKIEKLELPGIDFIKSYKRYYPNGDYASYTLGYTVKKKDSNNLEFQVGELGIEGYYDEVLKGKTGYVEYEKDKYGYKIPNGREYKIDAHDGDNIYLTIDSNIQLFVESAVKNIQATSSAEWALMIVADAKTGAILANSSTPSFDPNLRNMTSYLDPFVANTYEPGSTMKIFTYMCAIESGNYKGDTTYLSGSKSFTDMKTNKVSIIKDWNKKGWGVITYDQGFALSSNTAIADILETTINKDNLKSCFTKYGFGQKTGYTIKGELAGTIEFNYPIEVATAGYGQGITTTPMQHIQALTSLANGGKMLKPYIVSKITDSSTNKTLYEGKREVINTIASIETVNKLKDLMANVVNNRNGTGTGGAYRIEEIDLIAKTGTAQIFDYKQGKYLDEYIYSFSGMFPKDDPEVIIYTALKKPKDSATNYLAEPTKEVIKNINNYLNIDNKDVVSKSSNEEYTVKSYSSANTANTKKELENMGINVVILGDGDKIIKQYPSQDNIIYKGDRVFLLTNNYDKKVPNLIGYSYKEVISLLKLMDINYTINGNGYVYEQSILEGNIISDEDNLVINLKPKY